jgi:DNA-binding response OmpR family regulator
MKNVIQKRILIIDDDIDLLMLLERRLTKEGYLVESAASLPEAEEVLGFFKPHLVLLDINVNGKDGRKLCWKIKKERGEADVIVVIMSGYDYDNATAILFGADEVLAKPLYGDYLVHRTAALLENTPTLPVFIPVVAFNDQKKSNRA